MRWQSRETYAHLLLGELQNYNSLLNICRQENVGSHQKKSPCPRAKEKPQQDGRRGKITFRIKPHTHQRCLEGTNKTLCTPGDPTGTEPDLPLRVRVSHVEVWVNSGLPQGQGLWVQQTWVWHKPSWRRSPLTPQQSRQNLHRTGDTDSWRAQTKPLVYQDPGEKGSDPTRD